MKQLCKFQEAIDSEEDEKCNRLLAALKAEVKAKDTLLKQKLKKQV